MDTGRAGNIGGHNLDSRLGLSFFAKHGLLPVGSYRVSGLHTWPAPTYVVKHASCDYTIDRTKLSTSGNNGTEIILGWNFGANYTRGLLLWGTRRNNRHRQYLTLSDGVVVNTSMGGPKSFWFANEAFGTAFSLGTFPTTGLFGTGLETLEANHISEGGTSGPFGTYQQGLYVDTSGAGVMKCFMRYETGQWKEVASHVSAHLAHVRTANVYHFAEVHPFIQSTPMAIFAGA